MIHLTCKCCGIEADFEDRRAAFDAGWDTSMVYFGQTDPDVACDLCPASFIVLGHTEVHAPAHERWAREGRPASFVESMNAGDVPYARGRTS